LVDRRKNMKIQVLTDVLKVNQTIARENQETFDKNRTLVLNLMSSPGAGKTLIIEKTLERLGQELKFAAIEGDVATSNDAERLAKYDIPVIQITTESFGGACHLDANMVREAASKLDLSSVDILFIENIGNLICPAGFELGEHKRVVVLSVTEGEDKPTKYPVAFRNADILLLNKIDLLDYLDLNLQLLLQNSKKINPNMQIHKISARTGTGMEGWLDWIRTQTRFRKEKSGV
jgi:hydrogenase nickel incorporation protein HypB